jgi:hypothetical protein
VDTPQPPPMPPMPPMPPYPYGASGYGYGYQMPTGPRFGIGDVLGKTFKVWGKNLIPFALITAIVLLPHLLWGIHYADSLQGIAEGAKSPEDAKWAAILQGLPGAGLLNMLTILLVSALTYGVVMDLQGERAGLLAALGRGFARFFPTLGVGVLVIICTFGGLFLLIVPGVMLWCALYVAIPASVIEKPGLFGALSRSMTLTRGHRAEIFALGFIMVIANGVINKVIEVATVPEMHKDSGVDPEKIYAQFHTFIYADYIHNILAVSLNAAMVSVAYYLLRAEKEGTSAQELAKVFG